jgi:hypothetical protein
LVEVELSLLGVGERDQSACEGHRRASLP